MLYAKWVHDRSNRRRRWRHAAGLRGLTHGGFYAYFGSKQELQGASVAYGLKLTARCTRRYGATKAGRQAYADQYLSLWSRDNPGDGCTMGALAQEVARSTPETKAALKKGFDEMLSASGERSEVICERALLLGAIVMARAVQDPQLSEEILEAAREKLGCNSASKHALNDPEVEKVGNDDFGSQEFG
jgi:TetR/AcrR family transcriptional repressor of nem operon